MNAEHHERVGAAFLRARGLPEGELAAYLEELGDAAVRADVEELLRHDAADDSFLARPVLHAHAAAAILRLPEDPGEEPELPEAGAYRILRLLGRGNSAASVYLARQTSPVQRLVALKVLRQRAPRGEAAARFRAECDAIARMQHPGIATLFEASLTPDGRPFFVMEYIDGSPIMEYCARVQPGGRERLGLFQQVVEAVAHAHQKSVVHRDLKPSNILVAETADVPRVKVIDFGVAKCLDRGAGARSFATMHGQIVGTLAYMAPEQLAGDPDQVDVRADIYALGALLHEIMTGVPAVTLDGLELPEAIRRALRGRGTVPRQTRGLLPRDIDLIITKAMAPEPERRYQTAADLGAEIERYLQCRPIQARRPRMAYIARKAAARRPALTTGLAVALVAVNAAAPWVWVSRQRAQRQYEVSKETAKLMLNVIQPISDQIGTRQARRAILTQALAESRAFTMQESGDPEVQSALAAILGGLADLEEEEGRLGEARAMIEQVLVIRQRLAAADPGDPDRQAKLSIALVRRGDMHKGEGEWAMATVYYRLALQIDERLAALHPENDHYLSNLAWSYERLGARMVQQREPLQAAVFFDLQRRILERLRPFPGRINDAERCRSAGFLHLGSLALQAGDPRAALAHSVSARASAERALATDPASRLSMMCVFRSYLAHASASRALGDAQSMLADGIAAAAAVRPLVDKDATDGLAFEQYLIACDVVLEAAAMLGREETRGVWARRAMSTARMADPRISGPEHPRLEFWRSTLTGPPAAGIGPPG